MSGSGAVGRHVPVLAIASLLVALGTGCGGGGQGGGGGAARTGGPGEERHGAVVGELALPEVHADRPAGAFRFAAPPGHVLVVYFGYTTCPDVCPTTLGDVRRALQALGDTARRVDLAFVTVDPERDVPGVLEPYLASFVPGAHPLRPRSAQDLAAVERAFGASSSVTRDPDGTIEVSHSATGYLVDERGRVVHEWPFGTTPAVMIQDLRRQLRGAAA